MTYIIVPLLNQLYDTFLISRNSLQNMSHRHFSPSTTKENLPSPPKKTCFSSINTCYSNPFFSPSCSNNNGPSPMIRQKSREDFDSNPAKVTTPWPKRLTPRASPDPAARNRLPRCVWSRSAGGEFIVLGLYPKLENLPWTFPKGARWWFLKGASRRCKGATNLHLEKP